MAYSDPADQAAAARRHYDLNRAEIIARAKKHKQATRASLRTWVDEQKSRPCRDCGVKYPPYVMQFDHVRGEKKFNIGDAVNRATSKARIAEEIEKCEIVCANCHMVRTHG